jgi:hypothetical protein
MGKNYCFYIIERSSNSLKLTKRAQSLEVTAPELLVFVRVHITLPSAQGAR